MQNMQLFKSTIEPFEAKGSCSMSKIELSGFKSCKDAIIQLDRTSIFTGFNFYWIKWYWEVYSVRIFTFT